MKFSVVIPCHNAARWVEESINSVLNQSLQPMQIILIDDASTDNTERVISPYRQLDFFEYHKVYYRNAAQTRNECPKYVKGDWIAFLDADDVWYPRHLERARELLEKDSGTVGFINHYDRYSLDSEIVSRNCEWDFDSPMYGLSDKDFLTLYAKFNCFVGMSACIVSANRFKEIGGFDVALKRRHDIDMWLRLIHRHKWAVDVVSSSAYREDVPGNISQSMADRDLYKLRGLLKNKQAYEDYAGIYRRIIRNTAVSALNKSILYGDQAFQKEVMINAGKEVDVFMRSFFWMGIHFGAPYRWCYKMVKHLGLHPQRMLLSTIHR